MREDFTALLFCLRRDTLHLTSSRLVVWPCTRFLRACHTVRTTFQRSTQLQHSYHCSTVDVSFLMSTPLTYTAYYSSLCLRLVPLGRQVFHLLRIFPSVGWSGLSLTYTLQSRAAMTATPSPSFRIVNKFYQQQLN